MRSIWKDVGLGLIFGAVIPGIILSMAVHINSSERPLQPVQQPERSIADVKESTYIDVLLDDGDTAAWELESYITGVVLAEMPASFEEEALKAQAVVARTYALRAINGRGKHEQADVCTQSACCQAYCSEDAYLGNGGAMADLEKVASAVLATKDEVLFYGEELIEATYFSCSGGSTEDAAAVWGTEVPYLVATDSPGEEQAAYYSDTTVFTAEEFLDKLSLDVSTPVSGWFGPVTYTDGGGVDTMEICGRQYTGIRLRALLNLKSTAFVITVDGDNIHIRTRGFGHRVGMSQYGADAMALEGSSYRQILAHYYRGTTLEKWKD